jgi:hypothetical protein
MLLDMSNNMSSYPLLIAFHSLIGTACATLCRVEFALCDGGLAGRESCV